jgi:hypothetical protein
MLSSDGREEQGGGVVRVMFVLRRESKNDSKNAKTNYYAQ